MSFLPEDYEVPSGGGGGSYFKPKTGDNRLRILSDVVIGWQYWNTSNKPVRMREKPATAPADLRIGDDGKPDRVKHFWVVLAWDYDDNQLKIWEITQSGIQSDIAELANDSDWGHPKSYNILLKREGEKINTKYTVIPKPTKPLDERIVQEWQNAKVNLEAVFEDGAAPLGYDGIMPDGAAGSYNESRAVRLLNDMVRRANSDPAKLDQAKEWAMAPKQFTDIDRWAGGDGEGYINAMCSVSAAVAGAGGGVDASEIPFSRFGDELNWGA